MTIPEAADVLGISESKLRRAANTNRVPYMKVGVRSLVDVDAVREIFQIVDGVHIEVVSQATGLSVSAIRRFIREGWMPCIKSGKWFVFQMDAVKAAIEQRINEQMNGES